MRKKFIYGIIAMLAISFSTLSCSTEDTSEEELTPLQMHELICDREDCSVKPLFDNMSNSERTLQYYEVLCRPDRYTAIYAYPDGTCFFEYFGPEYTPETEPRALTCEQAEQICDNISSNA